MTSTLNVNAQSPASASVPQRREWKKPVIDILSLEEAQHGKHEQHADQWRDTVPMSRDEEENSGSEEDRARKDSNSDLPSAAAGLGVRFFVSPDGRGGWSVEQACVLPAGEPDFRFLHAVE